MSDCTAELALEDKVDDSFFMNRAKVEMCSRQDVHAYSACPYLHPNELASRRDPQVFKYDSIFCYDLHNNKICRRGVSCPYSHNLFEYFLHPSRYRTRLCEYGEDCKRELCFFAHNEQQLRPRTAIKVYSGGRRSGKQHRAAAEARAAAVAAAACSMYGSHSPKVEFLEVPALQPMAGSGPAHWVLAGPGPQAVSGWQPLEYNYQQQQADTGMYLTPVSMQQLQGEPPSIMVQQQQPSKAGSMEILRPTGFGCAQSPAGVSAYSCVSSGLTSSGTPFLGPAGYVGVQQPSAAAMSSGQAVLLEQQPTLVAAPCNPGSGTLPQEWSVAPPQQQVVMVATQQDLVPQQQQLVLAPQNQVDVLQHQLQRLRLQQPQLVASGPTDAFVTAMGQQLQSCTTPGGQVAAVNLVQSAGGVTGFSPGILASSGCSPVESSAGIAALMTASGTPMQAVSQQQQLSLLMAASIGAQRVAAAYPAQQQPMLIVANRMR